MHTSGQILLRKHGERKITELEVSGIEIKKAKGIELPWITLNRQEYVTYKDGIPSSRTSKRFLF